MKSPVLKLRSITKLILATLFISGAVLSPSLMRAQCSPDGVAPFITFCPSNVTLNTNGDTNSCQGRKYNWNSEIIDQQFITNAFATNSVEYWQSFTASQTGALTAIELQCTNGNNPGIYTLSIYSGVGIGGTLMYTGVDTSYIANAWFKTKIKGVSKPTVISGQQYTFRIVFQSSRQLVLGTPGDNLQPMFQYSGIYPYTATNQRLKYREYVAPNMVTATDNCNLVSITSNYPSTQYFPVGTTTVTHTATDAAGNTSTCSFDITVVDTHSPRINSVPANIVIGNGTGQCGRNVTWTAPVPADGCGISSFTTTHASGSFFPIGTTTVTYTAVNTLGQDSSVSFTVTVNDTQGPTPDIASLPTITGQCSATVSTTPTATDNCDGPRVATTSDPLTYNTEGTYTVHWTYTDTHGNTTTQNQTVIVDDNIGPVANITTLPTLTGQCSVTASTIPTATDNCSGTITATTLSPTTYSSEGTYTIQWRYNDGHGQTTIQNQTVIVDDNIAPVANVSSLPPIVGSCSATVSTTPTATDNCAGTITATTANPLTYTTDGVYSVTWTYNDGRGNTSTQTQVVVVDDNTAPVPTVSSLPTLSDNCSVTASVPTASDNCAGTINATTSDPTTYNTNGTFTIHWTYDDGRGNTTTQNQTVIINDAVAPVPVSGSLSTINAQCSATLTAPLATDNCAGLITGTTIDPTTYNSEGTYIVHWSYSDGHGNIVTQNQTVIIDDVTAPVPNVSSLPTINAQCSTTLTPPTATDNCSGTLTATTVDPLTYSAEGTYIVHWTYNDGRGNTSTQNQTVIIDDVTAPVANVGSLPTITGQCSATVSTTPTATDNCAGTITGTTVDPLSYSTEGTYIIHWTYNDGRGNTSTQNQTVIVDDNTLPVPVISSLPTLTNECSVTVVAPTANDNCAGTLTATTADPLTYTSEGTYTVHWTYNDGNGNATAQNQTVIVDDVTAPVANNSSLSTITAECSATLTAPTANDNCIGTVTATTTDPTTYNTQGTFTVTWTYNDGRGNTSTQTQTVIIDDVTAPVPTLSTLPNVSGECSATVTAPTATDNCGGTITATTVDPTSYNTQGTFTVHWIYDDNRGNTTTQNQTVVIDDITGPVANVGSLSTVTGSCSATVSSTPTATDNCSGTITATTSDPLTYTTQGTHVITWTYNDGNGNTTTQTQSVIVDDVTAPVADASTLPILQSECSVAVSSSPTATDNCVGSITATTTDPLTYSTQGIFTIHWVFNDGNGNTSTQTQLVVVDDNTAPVADNATLLTVTDECSASLTAPTATDGCAGTITATTTDPTTYNTQGAFTVTWTYNDGNGNTSTQTQTVIINDNTDPVADVSTLPTLTGCSIIVSTPPTATDNCSGSITATTSDPLTYSTIGTYNITWTYTDGAGNTSVQNQSVNVIDCAGIEDQLTGSDVSIYPNPGNGIFTLSLTSLPQEKTIMRVIDGLGQVIYTANVTEQNHIYDLSYLKAATYYVQVISNQNIISKTLIITSNY